MHALPRVPGSRTRLSGKARRQGCRLDGKSQRRTISALGVRNASARGSRNFRSGTVEICAVFLQRLDARTMRTPALEARPSGKWFSIFDCLFGAQRVTGEVKGEDIFFLIVEMARPRRRL